MMGNIFYKIPGKAEKAVLNFIKSPHVIFGKEDQMMALYSNTDLTKALCNKELHSMSMSM